MIMEQDDIRCILAECPCNDMLVTDVDSVKATLEEHLKGENYIILIQVCHPEFLVVKSTQFGSCHFYRILWLSDTLSCDIVPDTHIGSHYIPECVHLFYLCFRHPIQLRVEVFTQQFTESYLLIELEA